jgi:hypothetical protein
MKTVLRFSIAALLILPAAFATWFVAQHAWQLYGPPGGYSFGLHLRIGTGTIYDPWSDVIIAACALAALTCGIAVARDAQKKISAACIGAGLLGLIAAGVMRVG